MKLYRRKSNLGSILRYSTTGIGRDHDKLSFYSSAFDFGENIRGLSLQ
jgi:hypothetical protein